MEVALCVNVNSAFGEKGSGDIWVNGAKMITAVTVNALRYRTKLTGAVEQSTQQPQIR